MTLARRACAGLSLVELMIGLALGLLVVAGALSIHVHHLRTGLELSLQAHLHQEMRSAMDLITRDLRRARYWPDALQGTVSAANGAMPPRNPFDALSVDTRQSGSVETTVVSYGYQPPDDTRTAFQFRVQDGALHMRLGDAPFQPLLDDREIQVVSVAATRKTAEVSLGDACLAACTDPVTGTGTGPQCPVMKIDVLELTMTARTTRPKGAEIERTLTTVVRPRNDAVEGSCPVV